MKKMYTRWFTKIVMLCLVVGASTLQANAWYRVVAKNGTGDYTTIQAAIDAAPVNATAASPDTIFIRNGKYKEKITIASNKTFLQLIGESVTNTVLTYDDYASKVIACGTTVGTQNSASVSINASDFTAMNLTFENSFGDGSQAVALLVNADRAAFKNCRFLGNQDTLYTKGSGTPRCYFSKCYIDGNIDFIFGSSTGVFDSCVVYAKSRTSAGNSYITAANTPTGQSYGYVFRNSRFPTNTGATQYFLGRPWPSPSEAATRQKTVLLNCILGGSINPMGWTTWDANTVTSNITYAEFQSRNFDGTLTDVSQRVNWSKQFTVADTFGYNLPNMFSGWDPCTTRADFCTPITSPVAVSNFRAVKGTGSSQLLWNISWPYAGIRYQLFRSTDNVTYSQVYETTSLNDTAINFNYIDGTQPTQGNNFYYYVAASKAGFNTHITDTVQVSNVPMMTATGFLCSFSSYAGSPSLPQSYTVSGANLTGNLIVTPPVNFEVSLNGTNWFTNASPLSIAPTAGTVASTTIQVRLNAATPGNYAGNINHTTAGTAAIATIAVNGTTLLAPTITSNVLQTYPFTTNGNDSAAVRDIGVAASAPTFNKIILANGSQVAAITAYTPTYGQAYAANNTDATMNGSWASTAGGPGGNLNRTYYEQFTVTSNATYTVRVDSIVLTHNFYATASNLKLAIAYSKNGFSAPADSVDVPGATFAAPTVPLQNNAGPATVYRFALTDINGVSLAPGQTLTIRLYNACGSSSAGRYAMLKNVTIKGLSNSALPLSLLSFNGGYTVGQVSLSWSTANEVNTKDFTIERSEDARSFVAIGKLAARSTALINKYAFSDVNPLNGISYYRLKMTDINGAVTYSKTIAINKVLAGTLSVYPNPVVNDLVVSHPKASTHATIQVLSMDGKKIATYTISTGALQTTIDAGRLASGSYLVMYENDGAKMLTRFNKQ